MTALDRLGGTAGETTLAIKAPCLVATTANITLSGVQVIDGVTVGNNSERVLVWQQTNATQNGIYVASTGVWQLSYDCDGNTDLVLGTLVLVVSGGSNGGVVFAQTCTDTPVVIGTSLIAFAAQGSLSGSVPSRTAEATPVTILSTDRIVYIDTVGIAAAVAVNLPAAAGQAGLAMLTIQDSTGGAGTYNVTINPNGSEKINGLASVKITGAYGLYKLKPLAGGGWLIQ